jgi:hypothetical protein
MRKAGKKINPPKPIKVTIYRDNEQIDFLCGAILSYDEFEKICPVPKAPLITNLKTGGISSDVSDKRYQARLDEWSEMRVAWMIITSLASSEDIEWDTVDKNNPSTWMNYRSELAEFLTETEIGRLVNGCVEANSPTQKRRDEALGNFTPSQPENQITSSPPEELTSTSSTEPVKE